MSKPTYVPQARPVDDSTDYDCPDCGKLNYKPLRCQNCGHDPEQARPDGGAVVARGVISEATDGWLDCVELTDAGKQLPPGEYQFYTRPAPAPDVALPQWVIALRDEAERSAMKTGFNLTRDEVLTLTGSKFAPLTAAQQEADHG